jgi:hypothetical protein
LASGHKVTLTNGALAKNVFWQVAQGAGVGCSLGTYSSFKGTIMAYASIALNTGAVLDGRALSENGEVTLLANTIVVDNPSGP